MAPRKTKVDSPPAWYEPGLEAPNVSAKNLAVTQLLTVGENNDKGETTLRAGSTVPEAPKSSYYPFFMGSIVTGLIPLFFDYFYAVLQHYGLHALHLHPNSVLLLSIFAFYCEAYVVVMPSVALLRHFFFLRINDGHTSGCANFIVAGKANAISKAGKKADGFRSKWVMMDAKCVHPRLMLPTKMPQSDEG